jgi:4-amino-4-deoxy-L-arabinose transferase-like glycosyltransferase
MLKIPDFTKLLSWIENKKISPQFWILVLWVLLVLPTISLRSAHYEEGTVIGLARGALEDGQWLQPHLYGVRFIERPVLLSWLLALFSIPIGTVELWFARLVIIMLYLASGWLIFSLVRRYATDLAALFATLCFFVSPMLLQKVTTAEPDLLLSFLIFSAFVVWWNGEEQGGAGFVRTLAVALLLAAAGLVKGPQPLAYFFLGVGAYLLVRRRWSGLLALVFIGVVSAGLVALWYFAVLQESRDVTVWMRHSRLLRNSFLQEYVIDAVKIGVTFVLELLPGILLAIPLAIAAWRKPDARRSELILALALYALCCTLVLILWPGARGRYAMPTAFAVAALAGLAFDQFRAERRALLNASAAILCVLLGYKLALNWLVMPLAPSLFDNTRSEGEQIAAAIARNPAPLRMSRNVSLSLNALLYVDTPKRVVSNFLEAAAPPVWMILTPEQEQKLRAARPDLRIVQHLVLMQMKGAHLIEVTAN